MHFSLLAAPAAAAALFTTTAFALALPNPPNPNGNSPSLSAATLASSLISTFPDKSLALLPSPFWWWQSGLALDGLITYTHISGDASHADLLAHTLQTQATPSNDFMTPDATGNDDQAWWALAALSAAEYGIPQPGGSVSWINLAQNVFNEQKGRWDMSRCGGGMKWKISEQPDPIGFHYKSSIANGLFFQLAARLARFTGDAGALEMADKSWDWMVSVGLIDGQFNVFDGTDDSKGAGCVDVNHNLWSYNTGVFLYGASIMFDKTNDPKWKDRANGLLSATQRNFVKDGKLWEGKCEGDRSCNTDQVSFKASLARWMGASAALVPELGDGVKGVLGSAAGAYQAIILVICPIKYWNMTKERPWGTGIEHGR
ncbi:glycoside hydrolase [Clohesyomyces aquaticus]|uniref:mannan endo-1,6-alpha-mannosidase n=1 Tax=Clohesyomyces aquaticus TaxID=1231657 RepID=A0A1Y1YIH5_9PLEO|nr:glycoside hydrolase [Clohesyomyces aquaticus]